MHKYSVFHAADSPAKTNFIKFLAGILALLILVNLSWILALVEIYLGISKIQNLSRAFLNLELWLIFGNLSVLLLFGSYVFIVTSLRSILGGKAL